MNDPHDETTPPVGHGFAFREPFPLDAGCRIEALERQIDIGSTEREKLAARLLRRGELLAACRDFLREQSCGHLVARIDDEIGTDKHVWHEFSRGSVPIQGGG